MPDQTDPTGTGAAPAAVVVDPKHAEQELRGEVLTFMDTLRRGAFLLDLARNLRQVTKAVHEQKKKGTVVITLSIEPVKDSGGAVAVLDAIVAKPPKTSPPRTVMFSTEDGELTREHPDQRAMFSRDAIAGGGA